VERKELPLLWPDAGREVRETPIGPVAFEHSGATSAQPVERTRKRLRDEALEADLASGDIVPAEVASPDQVAETLSTGEIAARRAGPRGRAAGTLLHRLLELWDGRSETEPLLRQLAAEAGADADIVSRVRKRLAIVARSPFLARIAKAETVGREVPVRFRDEAGVLLERRIDRLLREEQADLVVDYKSGTPEPARVERDRIQVARYCSAIAAISGRPCKGALWYIDLDSDAVIEV
jgi:ATP-dependent exoDNAse (exonuclease V) beta subunit